MSELRVRVHRLVKTMCYLLALFVLGLAFTEYKHVFAGLILGAVVSLVNTLYTAVKVHQFGKRVAAGLKPRGLGMMTRFSLVALAALIAIRYAETFHLPSLAVGLILATVILYIDGLVYSYRLRHTDVERGEE